MATKQHGIVQSLLRRWRRPRDPPSLHLLARAFSSKLFVGGVSFRVDEDMLKKEFSAHGNVLDVKIIMDRETGRSRGFGFVTFSQESEAELAKEKMNNHLLDGRYIRVDLASNRPPNPGNSSNTSASSSSSSGFSFSSRPSRPPVVEDWGPLLHSTQRSSPTQAHAGGGQSFNSASSPPSTSEYSSGSIGNQKSPILLGRETSPKDSEEKITSSTYDSAIGYQDNTNASKLQCSTPSVICDIGAGTSEMRIPRAVADSRSEAQQSELVFSDKEGQHVAGSPNVISPDDKSKWDTVNTSLDDSGTASTVAETLSYVSCVESKAPTEPRQLKQKLVLLNTDPPPVFKPKLTVDSIPSSKRSPYDFGLSQFLDTIPPVQEGARLQGGFDIDVSLENVEAEDPDNLPYSIFSQRMLPPLDLPWETPEADNWSDVGKEPRRIEDSPYSPFSSDLKDDPEFWWDPYDFDAEAKLYKPPPEAEAANKEPEAEQLFGNLSEELQTVETMVKSSKEPEAEEASVHVAL